jgi:hypothetical protein
VFSTSAVTLTAIGQPNAMFEYYSVHKGMDIDGSSMTFDSGGSAPVNVVLTGGLTKVCVHLQGTERRSTEAETCIDVAFIPQ